MPQALDPAALSRRSVSHSPRQQPCEKPLTSFDEVMNRRSERPARDDKPREAEPEKRSEPATKSQKKQKSGSSKRVEDDADESNEEPVDETAAESSEKPEKQAEPVVVKSTGEVTEPDSKAPVDEKPEDIAVIDAAGISDAAQAAATALVSQQANSSAATIDVTEDATANGEASLDDAPIVAAKLEAAVLAGKPEAKSNTQAPRPAEREGAIALPAESATNRDSSTQHGDPKDGQSTLNLPQFAEKSASPLEGAASDESADPIDFTQQLTAATTPKPPTGASAPAIAPVEKQAAPERQFADKNVDSIVTTMKGGLMPTGGSMKIRLDPPHLGELNVDVTVDRNGLMSATFQTTNSEATRLLSHSLQDLRSALETTGVTIDRIQVRQSSSSEQPSSQNQNERERQQQNPEDQPARQEQQRREILERMWRKLSGGEDPLDLVV